MARREYENNVGYDLQIIDVEKGQSGIGTWVLGTVNGHYFEANISSAPSRNARLQFGDSRICKLHIHRLADEQIVYAWDRGPVRVEQDPLRQERKTLAIVSFLTGGALDQYATLQRTRPAVNESSQEKKNYDLKIWHVELEGWASLLVAGTVNRHSFCARMYRWHASDPNHEIGRSRICKLEVRRLEDNQTVFKWDHGPDNMRTKDALGKQTLAIVDFLTTGALDRFGVDYDRELRQFGVAHNRKRSLKPEIEH